MAIKQIQAWFLSQFYEDPIHPADDPEAPRWQLPVCTAYGSTFAFHRIDGADWGLVLMYTSPPQIEACKQDDRVVFCGVSYSTPPAQLLTAYASMLDPTATYMFMGQVLAKLSETEPLFLHN